MRVYMRVMGPAWKLRFDAGRYGTGFHLRVTPLPSNHLFRLHEERYQIIAADSCVFSFYQVNVLMCHSPNERKFMHIYTHVSNEQFSSLGKGIHNHFSLYILE